MIQDKSAEDGTVLEETNLVINVGGQEISLYTAQNFQWSEIIDTEVIYPPGFGEPKVIRKKAKYTWSLELDEPNHALLQDWDKEPAPAQDKGMNYFLIKGRKYYKLGDLPPFTITNSYPKPFGAGMFRQLFKCRIKENSGSIGVGEAAKRTIEGIALSGSGLI